MGRIIGVFVLVGLAVLTAACGGDSDSASSTTVDDSASTTGPTSSMAASTASTASTVGTTATTAAPTTATTSADPTTSTISTTTTSTTTSTTAGPTTTEVLVVEGGVHEFTSPSGNIACVMSEASASCWISEKAWTIEQPDGPDCDISDWGNVVDVTADGPSFPCYTDMGWNPSAPSMAYGNAVELGAFRCESAQSGVTCRNAEGAGFTVARAAVELF